MNPADAMLRFKDDIMKNITGGTLKRLTGAAILTKKIIIKIVNE
ncbi:hypothetical protein ACMC5U_04660 [Deferribacteres bacterium DY0609]|nr:hypothetical protein [Denitrovibrio acetiphilus]